VWIRVVNKGDLVVAQSSVSIKEIEESVDLTESSIRVALPEGEWYLEVSIDEISGPWIVSDLLAITKEPTKPTTAILEFCTTHSSR